MWGHLGRCRAQTSRFAVRDQNQPPVPGVATAPQEPLIRVLGRRLRPVSDVTGLLVRAMHPRRRRFVFEQIKEDKISRWDGWRAGVGSDSSHMSHEKNAARSKSKMDIKLAPCCFWEGAGSVKKRKNPRLALLRSRCALSRESGDLSQLREHRGKMPGCQHSATSRRACENSQCNRLTATYNRE